MNLAELEPTQDRILVQLLEEKRLVIIAPRGDPTCVDAHGGDYRKQPVRAKVLRVGPGKRDEDGELVPPEVRLGQVVLIGQWNDWEGAPEGIVMVREADILLVEGAA